MPHGRRGHGNPTSMKLLLRTVYATYSLSLATLPATHAQTAWIAEIKGSGWDSMYDMALDANGNAVVCGRFEGTTDFDPTAGVFNITSNGGIDGFVAKYDPNGQLLWAGRIGGSDFDMFEALAIDDAGNIALYGWFTGTADLDPTTGVQTTVSAGQRDGCVIKLDANGNLLWAFALENANQCYDGDIAFSPMNGDVVVTGYYETSIDLDPNGSYVLNVDMDGIVEENTIFMARYDANGNFIWGNKLPGSAYPHVSLSNASGSEVINWCVSGKDQSTSPSDLDPGPGFVQPVAGSNGSPMEYVIVAQYDASGNYLWSDVTATYYSSAGSNPPDVHVWAFETDAAGNIHVGGSIHLDYSTYTPNQASIAHLGLTRDGFVLRYNSTGSLTWEKMVGGPDLDDEFVADVTVDASGDVWIVAGLRTSADVNIGGPSVVLGALQETDIVVVHYDASGNYLWHGAVGGDWYDSGTRLDFWNGDAVLAGSYATFGGTADLDITSTTTAFVADGLYDGFITRFTPSITTDLNGPGTQGQGVVFPNPASDRITLNGTPTNASVEVFDALGQRIHSARASTIDVSAWSNGVYYLRMLDGAAGGARLVVQH